MALISLIHPSRSRPDKSFNNTQEWLMMYNPEFTRKMLVDKSGTTIYSLSPEVETIVSIDASDDKLFDYKIRYGDTSTIIINDNKSVVDATNHAAKVSTGDILIYLSDDFKCFPNWGEAVIKEFEGVTEPMLIKVDDCLQDFHVPVLTIPIMNRALYERLGYFWHPGYKSMFVDEDLYWTAKKLGALKMCPHLKFEHQHVSVGKAQDDETYRNSAKNWDQGKALFAKRKASGFPL